MRRRLSLTVFLGYTLAANRTDRSWFGVTTSRRRTERKLGWALRAARFCSACLRVELGRRSADVCLWWASPTNSWNASITWHACQVIDACTVSVSFAYYHTQKVEVTEYTTSHERHTKRSNYTESDTDDEVQGGMQITCSIGTKIRSRSFTSRRGRRLQPVVPMAAMREREHMLECTAVTKVKCLSQVPSE